jgi:hypothetical protein
VPLALGGSDWPQLCYHKRSGVVRVNLYEGNCPRSWLPYEVTVDCFTTNRASHLLID